MSVFAMMAPIDYHMFVTIPEFISSDHSDLSGHMEYKKLGLSGHLRQIPLNVRAISAKINY